LQPRIGPEIHFTVCSRFALVIHFLHGQRSITPHVPAYRPLAAAATLSLADTLLAHAQSPATPVPFQLFTAKSLEEDAKALKAASGSWAYTEAQYRAGFPSFLHAIRRISAHPLLIWATTTPVRADQSSGGSNARIDERNRIAQSFVHEAGITDDDQHALMMMHQDQHADNVHYNEAGAALMGDQVGSAIRQGLSKPKPQ